MDHASSDESEERHPPIGEVTFLFTDLEGSTHLWEDHPEAMTEALAIHDARLRTAITDHNGYVFSTAGDSFAVAFDSAVDAMTAAIAAQRALGSPCGALTLRMRVGLHTGVASLRDGDYFGSVVNRCARLMSAGHGGQVLISAATQALVDSKLGPGIDLVDVGEHRLKDLREPEHIFELRGPDLPSGFPPLRTLGGAARDLPVQLTDFVGRTHEISEVDRLLDDHRLVTLTGSGGSGKTRLALQVAADRLDRHPGATVLVELEAITDPQLVADEVAERVDATGTPDTTPTQAAVARIGERSMLLLLDNCEHVIDTVAELARELLLGCPNLRILATSQQALDIAGECRYRVPSLGLPDSSRAAEAVASDAVQLFATRASAARSDFVVDADNVDAVVSICRRLDGIPLAIELAAARVRVLSPEQIADRLDERFRLLSSTGRDIPPRHQTLRAAMDWSHDLLSETERAVVRRISVFAGDFTIEAAESVCEGDPVDTIDVLDHLTSLVDKSLVTPQHDRRETRFRLLDSIRAYGAERLEEADEADAVRARHAAYFTDVAERLYVQRRAGEIRPAIDGLTRDEDNIRAALRSTIDAGDLLSTARIIRAIGHLWYLEGLFREGIEWCQEFFDSDPRLSDEMLAGPLHVYGTLLGSWKQSEAGAEMLRREVDLLRGLDEPARLADALNNLGNLLNDLGRSDEAEAILHEAVEQFRLSGRSTALALVSLGAGYFQTGRYTDAEEMLARALDEATAGGNDYAIAVSAASLAQCMVISGGDLDEARSLSAASRAGFAALGVTPGIAFCELVLGHLEREAGNVRAAARHLRTALEEPDAHWYLATKYWIIQLTAGLVDDPQLADRLLATAEHHGAETDDAQPAWLQDDLTRTRALLGLPTDDGRGNPQVTGDDLEAVIDAARAELGRLSGDE